jgi:hypothetical protein
MRAAERLEHVRSPTERIHRVFGKVRANRDQADQRPPTVVGAVDAATRARHPRWGLGIFARCQPTSDMPNRFDRVRVDSDQTSLYSASRVKVQSGPRLSGRLAKGMGACSSAFEDIAVTRDAKSTTFLPCLSSARSALSFIRIASGGLLVLVIDHRAK